jgi:hypothetical protein
MKHLSGATLKPSHGQSFVEKWTSSVEGFLVNHSQEQESEKPTKTLDTFGHTSLEESKSLENLPLFSSKMSKEYSQVSSSPTIGQTPKVQTFCTMSSENWNDWVIKQRQEYSQRVKSVHRTNENEYSFLAYTPNSTNLEDLIFQDFCLSDGAMWRTPMVGDVNGSTYSDVRKVKALVDKGRQVFLTYQVQLEQDKLGQTLEGVNSSDGSHQEQSKDAWATPTARDWKGPEGRSYKGKSLDLPAQIEGKKRQADVGKLNPRWVETLMGLPIGWTMPNCSQPWIIDQMNLECLGTELFLIPQRERFAHCGQNWVTPRASQRGDNLKFFLKRCLEQVAKGKQTFSPMLQVQIEASERGLDIEKILRDFDESQDIETYINNFF